MGSATSAFNSSRAVIIINGVTFGVVTAANWELNFNVKSIFELDRVVARELAPSTYSVRFRLSGIKVLSASFDESGIIAAPGTNYLQPYISFALLDRVTNLPLLNVQAGMIESVAFDQTIKQVMTFDMAGTGFIAENDQTLLDNENNPPKPISP